MAFCLCCFKLDAVVGVCAPFSFGVTLDCFGSCSLPFIYIEYVNPSAERTNGYKTVLIYYFSVFDVFFFFFFYSVSGETKIGLKEFIDIQTEAEKASFFTNDSQAELIEALKCFDGSNDNTISKDDLRGILSEYDDTVIDDVFKAVGVNDDGKLSIRGTRGFQFYLGTVSLKFHIMVLHI